MHLRRGLAQAEREAAGMSRRFLIWSIGHGITENIIQPARTAANAAASLHRRNVVLVRVQV